VPEANPFIAVWVVARLLSVSESHVRNLIRRGELPAVRLGRRIVVPAAAVDKLLDDTLRQSERSPDHVGSPMVTHFHDPAVKPHQGPQGEVTSLPPWPAPSGPQPGPDHDPH
jgi:excisionase family DNA binding protein